MVAKYSELCLICNALKKNELLILYAIFMAVTFRELSVIIFFTVCDEGGLLSLCFLIKKKNFDHLERRQHKAS